MSRRKYGTILAPDPKSQEISASESSVHVATHFVALCELFVS
jgi:hypothetical protein